MSIDWFEMVKDDAKADMRQRGISYEDAPPAYCDLTKVVDNGPSDALKEFDRIFRK